MAGSEDVFICPVCELELPEPRPYECPRCYLCLDESELPTNPMNPVPEYNLPAKELELTDEPLE